MLGIRTFTASLFLVASASAQSNYWPLNVGNTWTYQTMDRGYVTLRVDREENFRDKTYSLLKGLPTGDAWLRSDDHGGIYAFNATSGREELWYDFSAALGEAYTTARPNTAGRAQIVTRNGKFNGLIGNFNNALELVFPGVTQPGIDSEVFLPWVGMVSHSEIAGIIPSQWQLVYASLGGVTVISQPETSFAIAVDSITSSVRITLRHTGPKPLELTFNSGQTFDIRVYNDRGENVYTWSATRLFLQGIRNEKISGERTWIETLPISNPGRFVAEAFLTTAEGPVFRATVPFTVEVGPAK